MAHKKPNGKPDPDKSPELKVSPWRFLSPKQALAYVSRIERLAAQPGRAVVNTVLDSYCGHGFEAHLVLWRKGDSGTGGIRLLIQGMNGGKTISHCFSMVDHLPINKESTNVFLGEEVDPTTGERRFAMRLRLGDTDKYQSWSYGNLKLPEPNSRVLEMALPTDLSAVAANASTRSTSAGSSISQRAIL